MPKITIQLGLTLPPEDLARLEALNFLPGEKVKVDPKIKFSHELLLLG